MSKQKLYNDISIMMYALTYPDEWSGYSERIRTIAVNMNVDPNVFQSLWHVGNHLLHLLEAEGVQGMSDNLI